MATKGLVGQICVKRESVTGHLSLVIRKKQGTNDK